MPSSLKMNRRGDILDCVGESMRMRKPHLASLDEVKISREGNYAVVEYHDSSVGSTNIQVGLPLANMSDQEVLDLHNDLIRAREKMKAATQHSAVEVPPGQPQISYSQTSGQWVPKGDVLRCVISDEGSDGEAVIWIDDQGLSLEEFGRLLCTYAGWGMRVVFVPDDEVTSEPKIELRETSD